MENINEPQPTVPKVAESTVQTAGTDQVQPPTEEPVVGDHVEVEAPSTATFSIQDLVHHDPEPESGKSTLVSYTGYWMKQTQPSKFVGKEGTVQELEGDPSQGSNPEATAQAEERNIPELDEHPHEAQDQGTAVAGEGKKGETDKSPKNEQELEPLKESTTLQKGGEGAIPKEVDLGHHIIEEGSSTESEASEDLRRKAETRRKARTLLSIEQQEKESQAEEKRLEDERRGRVRE